MRTQNLQIKRLLINDTLTDLAMKTTFIYIYNINNNLSISRLIIIIIIKKMQIYI